MARAVTGQRALRVTVADARGRRVRADALRRWIEGVAPRAARGDVVVALVGDRTMRALNQRYRRIDRVTDVLSFPATDPAAPASQDSYLGDIVIANGVARRQARAEGHPLGSELRCLALHGLLHLLGYDHVSDTGQMARLERRLRRKGGVG